jgi:nicotinate-nucleotide pyrophosphorylase (carboxylating)/molybdenum transport protein
MSIGQEATLVDSLEIGLKEDCPYGDITTDLLGIQGPGSFRFIAREPGVVAGTSRLEQFFSANQLEVSHLCQPGAKLAKGDVIIAATGEIKTLFKLWRIGQTYLTLLCAIATKTQQLVQAARSVNPDIQIVVACRKAHLGMRFDEMEAIRVGGALYHRNSLSDTILITQNHMQVVGSLPSKLFSLQHKIEFEPSSEAEAYEYAPAVDVIILDHFAPDVLKEVAAKCKALNPRLQVGVAGGITMENVQEYGKYVDIIVLSSVLYSPPLDITCQISRI